MSERRIARIFPSQSVQDGAGVKIRRAAIFNNLSLVDPFLMLDELGSDEPADYLGGFPSHPHRGFETITYMLAGQMRHTDHMGNVGLLVPGSVQWMTAGRGVIHSEMPEQSEGRLHGFQIWINLPARDKMQPARYQEFTPEQIPQMDLGNGGSIKVITGKYADLEGPVNNIATQPLYFDVTLPAGGHIDIPVDPNHNALLYCFIGEVANAGQPILQGQLAQFSQGSSVSIEATKDSRFLFLAALPIREPVVQYGPFVMNTREEIEQALTDYRNGTLTD